MVTLPVYIVGDVFLFSSVTDIAGQGVIVEQPSTTSSPTGLWSGDFTGMYSYFTGVHTLVVKRLYRYVFIFQWLGVFSVYYTRQI